MADAVTEKEKAERLSREFKSEPTIQNYLRLRRAHPDIEIEFAISGGIEFAFNCQDVIEEIGISVEDFLGLLDVDEEVVSRVCLYLLQDMVSSKIAAKDGQTHLSRRRKRIPENAIDWLICTMLDGRSYYDTLHLNRDLAFLIKSRLQAGISQFEKTLDVRMQKANAAMIGGQLKARGIVPSFRKVAKFMKVQPSTVKRWFAGEADFQQKCEPYSRWFDADGALRPLPAIARAQRPSPEH